MEKITLQEQHQLLQSIIEDICYRDKHQIAPCMNEEHETYLEENPEIGYLLIEELGALSDDELEAKAEYCDACMLILDLCLSNIRFALEHEGKWAKRLYKKLQTVLETTLLESNNLTFWNNLFTLFHTIKLPIPDDIKVIYTSKMDASVEDVTVPDTASFLRELQEGSPDISAFDVAELFLSQIQVMPSEFKFPLILELVATDLELAKDAAILFLLQPERETRSYALAGISEAFKQTLVTPISMTRLLTIRDWWPVDERPALEKFIAEQRKKQAVFDLPQQNTLVKIVASEMDGSGVQAFLFEMKTSQKEYQLCNALVKYNVGLRDIWCSPKISRAEADSFIQESYGNTGSNDLTLRKVDEEYTRKIFSHYIAVGHQRGEVPDIAALQMMEIINAKRWRADLINLDAELTGLVNAISKDVVVDEVFIEKSLQRSGNWFGTKTFTNSWFELGEEIDKLVNQHSTMLHGIKVSNLREAMPIIFDEVLESVRDKWTLQFLWMALWSKCFAKKNEWLWKDCYVLAKCLHEGKPLVEIPLMRGLCEETILASIETMQRRNTHLVSNA